MRRTSSSSSASTRAKASARRSPPVQSSRPRRVPAATPSLPTDELLQLLPGARFGSPDQLRSLFWTNFLREMLTSISATLTASSVPVQLDGRIALLTNHGERIPVAEVHPLFACSVPGSNVDRDLSAAVQCSIFRVVTPQGDAFTLPISEIRGVHALTEELQKQIEAEMNMDSTSEAPFGFAAYTQTAQQQQAAVQAANSVANPALESESRADENHHREPASPPAPSKPNRSRKKKPAGKPRSRRRN
ncbi:MAG: hypothetical protein IBJ18_03140 [Phycisphaerales bacterium]|nr:hypothetical protein [Phycisphaerales bacterium]